GSTSVSPRSRDASIVVTAPARSTVFARLGAFAAACALAGTGMVAGIVATTGGAAAAAPASGLAGDATPTLSAGTPGTVSVVAQSAPNNGRVAIIVRNDTDGPVNNVRVAATATRADGGAVTSANTKALVPATLAPGAYGLAVLDFRKRGIDLDAQVSFDVRSTKAASGTDPQLLEVSELTRSAPSSGKVAQTLTFTVANPTKRAVRGPVSATVMCFNEAGKPVNLTTARVRRAGLGAGKDASVHVGLAELCPTALVGARASSSA
ncbi:MAG: hypothetical protein U0W40_20650, partial [Acidimicrobiia bacterium]